MGSRYIYCGYKISIYLDIIFSTTVLEPVYYVLMNWFGVQTINGMTYEQLRED